MLMLAGIDDPKFDSTTSHTSSSSHSRVVCHPGHPASTIMGGLVLRLRCTCFVLLLSLSVGQQFVSVSATVTAISEPSVSAVVSVTP